MKTLPEQIREEICRLYDLDESQVRLELVVYTPDTDKGTRILKDFDRFPAKDKEYFHTEEQTCSNVYGEIFNSVWVHRYDRS